MSFAAELEIWLPADIPNRSEVLRICAAHLDLIAEVNEHLNLTRITTPEEAAIKHVVDSLLPWRYFEGAKSVLDAGTGAGLPGIPLASVLPETQFVLTDSIGKKARFVQSCVETLDLPNVSVESVRAEDLLAKHKVNIITARAVAPMIRVLEYFGPAVRAGARALLYKGPDVQSEIEEAAPSFRRARISVRLLERYTLPKDLGTRTLVELVAA